MAWAVRAAGRRHTKCEQLLKGVWGERVAPNSQTLEVHIRWLRQKVEPDPNRPTYIQTVRMVGYRFDGP